MAKNKALDIIEFEGGMNDHADARDIEDNQVAMLKNLIATNKGVLKVGYTLNSLLAANYPNISDSDIPNGDIQGDNDGNVSGFYKNIYVYKTDFNIDNNNAFTEYLLFVSKKKLFRLEKDLSNNSTTWEEILNFNTTGGSLHPALIIFDGNIRFSDGMFELNANSPKLPLTKTLFYGQVRRKYFTAVENTVSTITGNASVIKPTDGTVVYNDNIESSANNPTRGFLGLEINKVEYGLIDKTTFGTGSKPTISVNPSTSIIGENTADVFTEYSEIGEIDIVTNNSNVANSTIFDLHGNTSYSLSDIAPSNPTLVEFENVTQNTGEDITYLVIGDLSASTSSSAVGFIVTRDAQTFDGVNFNTNERSILIHGFFAEGSDLTVDWSEINATPVIYPMAEDGTLGSAVTITSQDNNQNNFAIYRFTDTTNANKYKVVLSAGSNQRIRFRNLQLFNSIATVSPSATSPAILEITVGGTNSGTQVNSATFSIHNGSSTSDPAFNTGLQSLDRVVFIRIAFPKGADEEGFQQYHPEKIELLFSENNSFNNNYRVYTIGNDFISKHAGKGWVDIVIRLDEIADIQGTAPIGSLDHLQIKLYKNENQSSVTTARAYFDIIAQADDSSGSWDGYYKFYYSWLYDNAQESSFYEFQNQGQGIFLSNNQIEVKTLIRELAEADGFGFGARGRRITGANIYYAEFDEINNIPKYEDPFKLLECNFERGVKKPISSSLEVWSLGTTATDHFTHSKVKFIDAEVSSTFSISSGYSYDQLNSIKELRFRTATVLNRRIYYGNVDIVWEKANGEVNSKYNRYGDRIYKSLSNKPDIVPANNFLEVDVNDGDEITALESYADRLLVYKKEVMYIINATKELEYLEDTHNYKGVLSSQSVAKTDYGIAWANRNGCYIYNGEKVIDLSKEKISNSVLLNYVGNNPIIVYNPQEQHILISNKNTDVNTNIFRK